MIAVTVLFVATAARAGDPEAHSTAMIQAARNVAVMPDFTPGVGAPKNAFGDPPNPLFKIDTSGSTFCTYTPWNPYGTGCAYDSINGLAVNEPDDWNCLDEDQPKRINELNRAMAPVQTVLATIGAARVSELAMACNWNHFTSNSALTADGNSTAADAYKIVRDWAEEIPASIEANGATDEWACGIDSWDKYYERVANASHYAQDAVTEHHDYGNEVCTESTPEVVFSRSPLQNYKLENACMVWLDETVYGIVGPRPPAYSCDQAIVDDETADVWQINGNMTKMALLCGLSPLTVSGSVPPVQYGTPMSTIACMGFERVLRHHCVLEREKSLDCTGPMNDHSVQGNQYCEGESWAGGGEDFLGDATKATEDVLVEAFKRWAEVCKQPDDPCETEQCTTWCQGTRGLETGGSDTQGYCVNDAVDNGCVLHKCQCGQADVCGLIDEVCCVTDPPCGDELECDGATGKCVLEGEAHCDDTIPFQNGDFTKDLAYWSGMGSPVDPAIGDYLSYGCMPEQTGNKFVYLGVWSGGYGYIEQTFDVPDGATQMSVRLWNALDPATAQFTIISGGDETFLGENTPPSAQQLSDPKDPYSVECSGTGASSVSYPIGDFAGKRVTLRLAACCGPGNNGTYMSFDDVTID